MNDRDSQEKRSLMSRSEEQIMTALSQLPPNYLVSTGESLRVAPNAAGAVGRTYSPDFVIKTQNGQEVVVEVKSPQSLTMVNLSRFAAIDKQLRAEGNKFLVLVPDNKSKAGVLDGLGDFQELNIQSFSNASQIIDAVLSEFDPVKPD